MKRGAEISECERYRYRLWRRWGLQDKTCCFIMLNPSTADGTKDDATIRRCVSFAKREVCSMLTVVNLFAWRCTDPKAMFRDKLTMDVDIIGPENDNWIRLEVNRADIVVAAWGAQKGIDDRVHQVKDLLQPGCSQLWCLGKTKHGYPRHPVRLAGATPLELL